MIADLALHRVDRPEDDGRRHDCRVRISPKRYPDVHRGIDAKECLASRMHIWLRPVRIAGVGNGLQEHRADPPRPQPPRLSNRVDVNVDRVGYLRSGGNWSQSNHPDVSVGRARSFDDHRVRSMIEDRGRYAGDGAEAPDGIQLTSRECLDFDSRCEHDDAIEPPSEHRPGSVKVGIESRR